MYRRAILLILTLSTALFPSCPVNAGSVPALTNSVQIATPAGAESPILEFGTLNQVLMDVHNTENYQLNGSQADAQWEALIPASGGLVRVGPQNELFMVSMYHQLKCLDIIRRDYVAGLNGKNGTDLLTRHCLNYIRQMVLCHGDRRLETCGDWTQVYKHSQ
ncbi:hypothetical protein C8R44DRAFT_804260 [Mycena epipterygia]|nr:hypothetical protein C8R44DRAFT_804260 [Mycena epipterygia]